MVFYRMKDGVELKSGDEKYKMKTNGNEYSLYLEEVDVKDSATYSVEVSFN